MTAPQDPFGGQLVVTADPNTKAMSSAVMDPTIAAFDLAKKSDINGKANTSDLNTLAGTVGTFAAGIDTANQKANQAVTAAGSNLAAVPAQSKAALLALGYLPRIVYNAGWPALNDALAAMGMAGYTGAVRWDSAKSATAPAPTGARVGDEWERKKA